MGDTAGAGASRRRPRSVTSSSSERADAGASRGRRRSRSRSPPPRGCRREEFVVSVNEEEETPSGLQLGNSPAGHEERGEESRSEAAASVASSAVASSSSSLNEDTEDGSFILTEGLRLRKGMHYLDDKWFFYGNLNSCLMPAIHFVSGDQGSEEIGVCPSLGELARGAMPQSLVHSLLRPTVIPDSDDEIGSDASDAVDAAISNLVDDHERLRRYFRSRRYRSRCIRAVWRAPMDLRAIVFYGERGAALQDRLDSIPVPLDSLSPISPFEMEDFKAQVTALAQQYYYESAESEDLTRSSPSP